MPSPKAPMPLAGSRISRARVLIGIMAVATVAVFAVEVFPRISKAKKERELRQTGTAGVKPAIPPSEWTASNDVRFQMLNRVKDGTPVEEQGPAYDELFKYVASATPESMASQAKTVEYGIFTQRPEAARGRVVRVTALFLKSDTLRLEREIAGREWIHRTYLMDLSGNEGYVVDLADRPPDARQRDVVTTDAVFLKIGAYESNKGPVNAPVFLARSMTIVDERAGLTSTEWTLTTKGLAAASVLGVGWLVFRIGFRSRAGVARSTPPPAPVAGVKS